MMEEWKDIEGYEGLYQVSNCGRVKSTQYWNGTYERILTNNKDKNGYLSVALFKEGKRKWFFVHRLVAQAFLENPDNLNEVNHINENNTDNRAENLEYCSRKYNCNYGTRNQRIVEKTKNGKLSKTVYQYTLDSKFIAEYPSTQEVERQLGYSSSNIRTCCRGKQKTAYGYKWTYK